MLGEYAELAVWDAEIPAWVAEAYAEHGMSPKFWPHNLIFYAPLWRLANLVDHVNGSTPTEIGTPLGEQHPTVYYPSLLQLGIPGVIEPVAFQQPEPQYPRPEVVAY
jgi:hypothetical protein